jgi:SAM-dependent methyltransferase
MIGKQGSAEWNNERGEKWLVHAAAMEAMLSPVNEPLIRALQLDAPCRVADIGCGGGEATLEIARRAPRGSVVDGFDISPALVALARNRAPSGESSVAFELADMATAAPQSPAYDRLVSRFGIMFFDDPRAAFANLPRWLTPGGRFAFAVWGAPGENEWMASVREAVGQAIRLPPSDPEAPGPFRYADAAKLLALLDGAGFRDLAATGWRGTFAIGGGLPVHEAVEFALASFSSFADLLANAGEDAIVRARQQLTRRFSEREHDGVVRMAARVHIVTGTGAAA